MPEDIIDKCYRCDNAQFAKDADERGRHWIFNYCEREYDPERCERCDFCGVLHEGNHNCEGD